MCVHATGNCFPRCSLHTVTCLDIAIPAHWGEGDGGSLEDQAAGPAGMAPLEVL